MNVRVTTLLRVTGTNEAAFALAHPEVMERSTKLHSPKIYSSLPVGGILVATLWVSKSRRTIGRIHPLRDDKGNQVIALSHGEIIATATKFCTSGYEQLKAESERYAERISTREDSLEHALRYFNAFVMPSGTLGESEGIVPAGRAWAPSEPISVTIEADAEKLTRIKSENKPIEKKIDANNFPFTATKAYGGYWVNGSWVTEVNTHVLAAAAVLAKSRPVNLLIIGPSGYGKTSTPASFAKEMGMEYLRVNCAQVRDPEEWFGYREAVDGSTLFVPSEFTKVVTRGNAVIVLDEFNRVEPWLHNTLYPLLDHDRSTTVHEEKIVVGPNVIFCMTINMGYQFVGTWALDQALTNRMDCAITVSPLPAPVEARLIEDRVGCSKELAAGIVDVLGKLRSLNTQGKLQVDASTRTSLRLAELISTGYLNFQTAVLVTLGAALTDDERKEVIDITGMKTFS